MRTPVVILSSRSIFAEGVASQLRQHLDELSIEVVDIREPDALERVVATQPAAVILDASDAALSNCDWLNQLLNTLPKLKLLRLDPLQDQMQVVTSEHRHMGQVQELMDIITQV